MRKCNLNLFFTLALVAGCDPLETPDVTEIDEGLFHLALPGQWQEGEIYRTRLVWSYECCGGKELVGITIMPANHDLNVDEVSSELEGFLDFKISQETKWHGEDVQITGPDVHSTNTTNVATYSGVDGSAEKFASRIFAGQYGLSIVDYVASDLTDEQFENRKIEIFEGVNIFHTKISTILSKMHASGLKPSERTYEEAKEEAVFDERTLPSETRKRLAAAYRAVLNSAIPRCSSEMQSPPPDFTVVVEISSDGHVARSWSDEETAWRMCFRKEMVKDFSFTPDYQPFFTFFEFRNAP